MGKFFRLTVYSATTSVLGYMFNLYLARRLGLEDFGLYSLAIFYASILTQVSLFGTNELIVRYLNSNEAYLYVVLKLRFLLLGLLGCSLIAYSIIFGQDFALLILAAMLTGFGFPGIFEYLNKQVLYAKIYSFQRIAFFALVLICLSLFNSCALYNVLTVLFAIDLLAMLVQLKKIKEQKINADKLLSIKGLLKEGGNILVFTISKMSLNGSIRYVLPIKLGLSVLSVFSLSWQFVTFSSLLYTQATRVFRSDLYKSYQAQKKFKSLFIQYVITITVISTSAALFVYHFGEAILIFIITEDSVNFDQFMPFVSAYILLAAIDSMVNVLIVMVNRVRLLRNTYLTGASLVACSLVFYDYFFSEIYEFLWTIFFLHLLMLVALINRIRYEIVSRTQAIFE